MSYGSHGNELEHHLWKKWWDEEGWYWDSRKDYEDPTYAAYVTGYREAQKTNKEFPKEVFKAIVELQEKLHELREAMFK